MRIAFAILAVTLAACSRPAQESAPAPAAPQAPPTAFVGDFTAISTTAMAMTGDMNATADVLSFARGFRIEGPRVVADLTGETDLSAGGGTLSSGSGVQDLTDVELRRVDLVRVAADARNPALCGDTPASYAILARGGDAVTLHVFSGADAPGPNAHDTQLCAIFNFAPANAG